MALPVACWEAGFKRDRLRLAAQIQNGLRWEVEMRFNLFSAKSLDLLKWLNSERSTYYMYMLYVLQCSLHTWFYEHGSSIGGHTWVCVWGEGAVDVDIYGYKQRSGVNRLGGHLWPSPHYKLSAHLRSTCTQSQLQSGEVLPEDKGIFLCRNTAEMPALKINK